MRKKECIYRKIEIKHGFAILKICCDVKNIVQKEYKQNCNRIKLCIFQEQTTNKNQ